MDALFLLAQHPEGLPLGEIARELHVKPPTAHNLLRTLASRGFVERLRDPVRYRLGGGLLDLAATHWRALLPYRGQEAVTRLARRFPSAVMTLAQFVGREVVAMLRASPERPEWAERGAYQTMHPYGTASALVFQAFWTEEQRAAYRQWHPFWEHGAHLWRDIEAVDEFLEQVRQRGHAVPDQLNKPVWPAAVPVFSPGGGPAAALGIAIPLDEADRATRREVLETLKEAAGELTHAGPGRPLQEEPEHVDSRTG